MIKSWSQFIKEFVNSENYIDTKMQEIKDLVDGISDKNIIYEWQNKNDHQLTISFSTSTLSLKYEFDIDELKVMKIAGDVVDFETEVESIDEGIDIIEKDIQSILGISERIRGDWSSSLTTSDSEEIIDQIVKFAKINVMDNTTDSEGLVTELEGVLMNYDKETVDLVVDTILFCDSDDRNWIDWATDEIIRVGDKIMSKYGTEPMQVVNAYRTAFNFLKRNFNWDDEVNERTKAQRYKGRKIPGKYLTKNPGKMKKEIDTFRGKKEYKKDWDADYTSGKGGKGKRVKTKKSAATKAYQRMFGNKEK